MAYSKKPASVSPTAVFENVAPQALVELRRGMRNTGKRRSLRNIFGLAMCDRQSSNNLLVLYTL